jgi:hypothetical protein
MCPRLRVVVRAEEAAAIGELGLATLRRLKTGDPVAPGWRVVARLVRPLDMVNVGLDSPHRPRNRRRAMLDVVALLLRRCAQLMPAATGTGPPSSGRPCWAAPWGVSDGLCN